MAVGKNRNPGMPWNLKLPTYLETGVVRRFPPADRHRVEPGRNIASALQVVVIPGMLGILRVFVPCGRLLFRCKEKKTEMNGKRGVNSLFSFKVR